MEGRTMWLCMSSSRGILYSTVIVGWNDLDNGLGMKKIAIDFVGVGMLIVVTLTIVNL